MRGIDYYTLTVFEVASERLGAQNALLGGGRYDELVGELGGPPTPAVGFAIGEDRLVEAMTGDVREPKGLVFVIPDGPDEFVYALGVSNEIRGLLPDAIVESDYSGRGIGKGLGRAGQIARDPGPPSLSRGGGSRGAPGLPGAGRRHSDDEGSDERDAGNLSAAQSSPERLAGRER